MGQCSSKQPPSVDDAAQQQQHHPPQLPPATPLRPTITVGAHATMRPSASSDVLNDIDSDDDPAVSTTSTPDAADNDVAAEPDKELSPTALIKPNAPPPQRLRREPSMNRPVRSSNVRRMFGQLKNFQREVHDVFDTSPDKFVTFHSFEYDDLRAYENDHWIDAADITVEALLPSSSMIAERGRLDGGQTVFLRRLNKNASSYKLSRSRRLLVAEIQLTSRLRHPNIVQFLGFSITLAAGLVCVSEYISGHSLQRMLSLPNDGRMTWADLNLAYALQLSSALVYMHALSPQVLHGNLKSDHLYIDSSSNELKVSGFGFSMQSPSTHKSQNVWNAPEVLQGLPMTQKVDVYSLGIVLMELDTRRAPFFQEQATMNFHDLLLRITTGTIRPHLSPTSPAAIGRIIHECIQYPPSKRPSADWVLSQLHQVHTEIHNVPCTVDDDVVH
ncbi:hypothetical protein DYB25_008353 [Aphanomyces astaci]|uniref:Protein kinase domain-containing protein n=2 Tax=Aphanomyces astaci TaxID=112090 RepID=A0A397A1Q5_APHAT|nr:hypothetical protein DYB36_006285 [Aphanomyces astaci]RHY07290.1 hypothetical protein DYB25_008353 [Aphanomyces astaci]RHY37121.1 hypothetical protein DYB38_004141 [Aphanomyces astaci]RHY70807.1 hypothetical protein DYB34_009196 [Aphanomyces astaci]RHY71344.1 hypothetical protein DYB30_012050 [Aphanomyces astaci]